MSIVLKRQDDWNWDCELDFNGRGTKLYINYDNSEGIRIMLDDGKTFDTSYDGVHVTIDQPEEDFSFCGNHSHRAAATFDLGNIERGRACYLGKKFLNSKFTLEFHTSPFSKKFNLELADFWSLR